MPVKFLIMPRDVFTPLIDILTTIYSEEPIQHDLIKTKVVEVFNFYCLDDLHEILPSVTDDTVEEIVNVLAQILEKFYTKGILKDNCYYECKVVTESFVLLTQE